METLLGFKTKIKGANVFIRALQEGTEPAERARVLKRAFNRVKSQLVGDMRRNITAVGARETGTLRRSITGKVITYSSGVVIMLVGPRRRKYANGRNPANYAHLVELGTSPHSLGKGVGRFQVRKKWRSLVAHPGATAKPFLEPTSRQSGPRLSEQIAVEVLEEKRKQLSS